jgi:hypothetical protein
MHFNKVNVYPNWIKILCGLLLVINGIAFPIKMIYDFHNRMGILMIVLISIYGLLLLSCGVKYIKDEYRNIVYFIKIKTYENKN